ncbi:MAG: TldD/PmbA family protein [Clostridia bacterium]|nr:TldD/PmbA family protein [Clostridia bacterium]
MSFEEIKKILFDAAKEAGLTDYDVYYRMSTELSADALNHEPNASSFGTAGGVSFRCAVDGKIGSASTEMQEKAELEALVPRAMANAALVDADEEPIFYLPQSGDAYRKVTVDKPALPTAGELRRAANELQDRIYNASDLVSDGTETMAGAAEVTVCLANARGLMLSHSAAMRYAYAEAVINDGNEPSYGTAVSEELDAAKSGIAEKAVSEAILRLGGSPVKTGKYKVVLSAKQVRALFSAFSDIFSGKKAMLGLSLLKGKENTKIASPSLTVYDDPFYPGNTMQMPFDAEGVPTYKKALVEQGVLKTLLYDLTTAKKTGNASTGNAGRGSYADPVSIRSYCYAIAPGSATLEELFAEMGEGLYITELKGLHAGCDDVTGDFSIESAGFAVKDGKLASPVKAFTVAGNFFELLQSIEAVGREVETGICGFSMTAAPAMLVKDISVAGEN